MSEDEVRVETATIYSLTDGCALCGHTLVSKGWFLSGNERDRCSGCFAPLNNTHVVRGWCGGHNTVAS